MALDFNPLTGKFDVVVKDHGLLTGLTDDDHSQYLLLAGRSGQIIDDNINITEHLSVGAANTQGFALGVTDGSAQEAPAVGIANSKAISMQGAGAAYFHARDTTNDIEFIVGTSITGVAFVGSMTSHDLEFRYANSTKAYVKSSGIRINNLGVGTNPDTIFISDVAGRQRVIINTRSGAPSSASSNISVYDTTAVAKGVGGAINFTGKYTGSTYLSGSPYIRAYKESAVDGEYGFALSFGTRDFPGSPSEKMRLHGNGNLEMVGGGDILSTGNVGIGTTSPDEKLDVDGNIQLTGSINNDLFKRYSLMLSM